MAFHAAFRTTRISAGMSQQDSFPAPITAQLFRPCSHSANFAKRAATTTPQLAFPRPE
jgi:hypothetical protein